MAIKTKWAWWLYWAGWYAALKYFRRKRQSDPCKNLLLLWLLDTPLVVDTCYIVYDPTIAGDNAKFGQTGPKWVHLMVGLGSSYLARIVGKRKRGNLYLCRQYNAEQALEMGLVNHVVSC